MFSTDKNIETIAQLIEVVRHYIGLQSKYMKLDVIDKIVRLFTALIMVALLSLLLFIGLIYLSFAAVYALHGHSCRICVHSRCLLRSAPAVCSVQKEMDRASACAVSRQHAYAGIVHT